jgi:hypothetical protein
MVPMPLVGPGDVFLASRPPPRSLLYVLSGCPRRGVCPDEPKCLTLRLFRRGGTVEHDCRRWPTARGPKVTAVNNPDSRRDALVVATMTAEEMS